MEHLRASLAGRYEIRGELGRGGMATVYLAGDPRHGRDVAIKVLRPELASALGPDRFVREIRIAAPLSHPNILPLYDSGEADGLLYYVMPYIEGESLRDRLERERLLPVDEALRITQEVADGLGYAHSRGIVHRDVKPENILLTAGHAVVADFGIARAVAQAGGERLTESGFAIGTPAYMSPEQAAGEAEVDGRSDLYSLGCVLYEMLSGTPPHTGASAQAVLARKLSEPAGRISVVRETVPPGVEAALGKVLTRTPADRFSTAAQVIEALRAEGSSASLAGAVPRRRSGAWWRWVVGAAAAVGLAVAGGRWATHRGSAGAAALDPSLIAAMPFRAATTDSTAREIAAQVPTILWTKVTGQFGPRATDPASVGRAWTTAGGTPESGLPDLDERHIAQTQGAGLMLRGVVSGSAGTVSITASLERARDGQVRVAPITVSGPSSRWVDLMDSLVVLVLAHDFGTAVADIPRLSRHPAQAVQAYLAGLRAANLGPSRFAEAGRYFDQALQADSTFVEASVAKYTNGETDVDAAKYAWAHRDLLSPRDRAFLLAMDRWLVSGPHSFAQAFAAWDTVVAQWPEMAAAWRERAYLLVFAGSWSGIPHWRERAVEAARRAATLDPESAGPPHLLWELAFQTGDSSEVGTYLDQFLALSDTTRTALPQRWRVAVWLGDRAAAARAFQPSAEVDVVNRRAWEHYVMYALEDGRGAADADRAAQWYAAHRQDLSGDDPNWPDPGVMVYWELARGRRAEWHRWRDTLLAGRQASPRAAAQLVLDALAHGEPEDSALTAALGVLADAAQRPDTGAAQLGYCWPTLWRLAHGDTTGARSAARWLSGTRAPRCAGLVDVAVRYSAGEDVRESARSLDSLSHAVVQPYRALMLPYISNLLLARLLARIGDSTAALAAVRRERAVLNLSSLSGGDMVIPALREEGRLAAATGDRSGAIRAYRRYLALREDPDWPPWIAQRDSVRRELAALTGGRAL